MAAAAAIVAAGSTAIGDPVAIQNFSFEVDRNPAADGGFAAGEAQDFGGELDSWIRVFPADSGGNLPAVGFKDIDPLELHPSPPEGGLPSQALSLRSESAVVNTTFTPW